MEKFVRFDEKGNFMMSHEMPFDEEYGMKRTREEILKIGYLVESIPEPEQIEGKSASMKFNVAENAVYYEYVDIPPQPKTPEQEIEELKTQLAAAQSAIDFVLMNY